MASTTSYSPKVQKRTLKGHRQQVLCIAHSSGDHVKYQSTADKTPIHHPNLLLSGSEDGTARLWDLRMRKTAYCMIVPTKENEPNDVTSVAFHPSIVEGRRNCEESGDYNDVASRLDCMVYISSGCNVYGYDLRNHTSGPIIKTPHLDLSSSFQCLDEINQLSFSFPKRNKDGSRKYHMSAVDDCGEVHIPSECIPQHSISQQQSPISTKHTVLHHAEPASQAISSSAVFRPRVNATYLASGGTDCVVKLFDVSKPKRATSAIHIKPTESENTTQICNPPFIHSLQWSPSGRLLAAGVGDGSCVILRGEGNRLVEIGRLGYEEGGHAAAVASVCFPGFGSSSTRSASVEAEDRLLISAGNDGKILFWDLGGNMVDGDALDPLLYLSGCGDATKKETSNEDNAVDKVTDSMDSASISSKKSKGKNQKKGKKTAAPDADLFLDDLLPSPPKVLFQIQHNYKSNWITCSRASDAALPSSVFVADTTSDISIYTLPTT